MLDKVQDEVYFHMFLKARREMMDVTLETVSDGVCSASTVQRMEQDENVPEKLIRNRIVARLGISGEKYEDYLPPKEYERWILRQNILKSIERKQLLQTEQQLMEYQKHMPKKSVERQFVAAMKFMLLQMKHAPIVEQKMVIQEAVKETVRMKGDNFPKELLLADQEINLLIEYVALHGVGICEKDVVEWRLREYREIIAYIENSHIDNLGRTKIYPKAVYYWMKLVCDCYAEKSEYENIPLEVLEYGLDICEKAIELLRDIKKLFYFVELLEVRKIFLEKKSNYVVGDERKEILNLIETTYSWHEVFWELYKQYEVSPYMAHFCHLYWEMQSYPMGKIIRTRRKMKGMTKEDLSDETCDLKSITRCEKDRVKTQKYTIRGVFPKVGLGNENICGTVVTNDYEVLELYVKMIRFANNYDFDNWEKCLEQLEKILCMDISQNRQIIARQRSLLDYRRKNISDEEFIEKMKNILELTISSDDILSNSERYITKNEMACIYSIAMRKCQNGENQYLELLKSVCEKYEQKDMITSYIIEYERTMTGVASWLGNTERYDDGDQISHRVIKKSLIHRRMGFIASNLYYIHWNNQQKNLKGSGVSSKEEVLKVLKKCLLLVEIPKLKVWINFLKDKISSEE